MGVTDPKAWLSFSLTPVQGFIEAARSVRDLKVGSQIISHLVHTAIEAGRAAGGTLLFPSVDEAGGQISIPNQFMMEFSTRETAQQAAARCEDAARKCWNDDIAKEVHDLLKKARWGEGSERKNWNALWQSQIERFWSIVTVVVDSAECTEEAYKNLFGKDANGAASPWIRQWRIVSAALDARKQIRHFPGDFGAPVPKCTMFGDLEQMGPGGSLSQHGKFWTAKPTKNFTREGIKLTESDRLSAVALVKRFASAFNDSPLKSLCDPIPDTAAIAIEDWIVSIGRHSAEGLKRVGAWEKSVKSLRKVLGEEAETSARWLLDEELDRESLRKSLPEDSDEEKFNKAFADAQRDHDALMKLARDNDLGSPNRYFAILVLDGDRIGERLSGDAGLVEPARYGAGYLEELSRKLLNYATVTAPDLVQAQHGQMIYCGGDDLLALLPTRSALAALLALRDAYPQLPGMEGKPTTASAGVAWIHYKHDLRDGLRRARAAVRQAKTMERDAVGWHVAKRSGGAVEGWSTFSIMNAVQQLARDFADGASDRWVYRLERAAVGMNEFAEASQIRMLLRHYLLRALSESGKDNEGLRNRLREHAEALLLGIHSDASDRHPAFNRSMGYREDENDTGRLPQFNADGRENGSYWTHVIATYLDHLHLASFLARGGRS